MTTEEYTQLTRPYLLKQIEKREQDTQLVILSALLLALLAAGFALTLAFVLNS
jgi:hypothetical protein